ncbi:MAG: selenoneine synthase SenA [Gammaproteobacteria bacterium]
MKNDASEGVAMRGADRRALGAALTASRGDTLATFAACDRALGGRPVPPRIGLNPLLWELGHIGWFQEFWIARNPERSRGIDADPDAARLPGVRPGADALYDSSRVPHASRWHLPLPDAQATCEDLAAQLDATQTLLREASEDDASLYFFRLALFHEDMHHEAALYMAHALRIPLENQRWQAVALPDTAEPLAFDAGEWRLGSSTEGFAFDNELSPQTVELGRYRIDSRVVRWGEYLPFVEAGGYQDVRWWSAAGRTWLARHRPEWPRFLKRAGGAWMRWRNGAWVVLDPALAACHLTCFEAEAWCAWAGRRLPTECEWERAALTAGADFRWGDVWEWTASPFAPYPGFVPHPYRDYSRPWFDGRPVLRGASFATQPRMRHPAYRNYFPADRNDIFAGFRTCDV